uniref:Uncharacterized protein n=1 Tax=Anopheles maculatus TaxID=74869 RepID=A0A182SHS8_9DIPT
MKPIASHVDLRGRGTSWNVVVMVSQNLSTPDGTQHTQRKQMEILQARTSAGSLQVVRAQTVQTTSSRWSSSSSSMVQTATEQTSSHSVGGATAGNIMAGSPSSHHQQQQLTTNGFSSHHLLSSFHRPLMSSSAGSTSSSRLLVRNEPIPNGPSEITSAPFKHSFMRDRVIAMREREQHARGYR